MNETDTTLTYSRCLHAHMEPIRPSNGFIILEPALSSRINWNGSNKTPSVGKLYVLHLNEIYRVFVYVRIFFFRAFIFQNGTLVHSTDTMLYSSVYNPG